MSDNKRAAVLASFAADALALGPHWIYDTSVIDSTFGRVTDLQDPPASSFHKGRSRGEFTHYGDQTLVLLVSIAKVGGFTLSQFAEDWRALFDGYTGYRDHATKDTLINLANGRPPEKAGSESTDLAGASRIAPLAYRYADDPDQFIASARAQTAFTHNQPDVIGAAEFFARVTTAVLGGDAPTAAIQSVTETQFSREPFTSWVEKGLASSDRDTRAVIGEFGQNCSVGAAFPSVVHLVARHEGSLEAALVENVMSGGDSAARGMMVGMVLGAHHGTSAVPETWLTGMKAYQQITDSLAKLS